MTLHLIQNSYRASLRMHEISMAISYHENSCDAMLFRCVNLCVGEGFMPKETIGFIAFSHSCLGPFKLFDF